MISAAAAIERHVKPGDTVVIAPGMGEPRGLVQALAEQAERLAGTRVLSGLTLGDNPLVESGALAHLRYDIWHVTAPVRDAVAEGRVGFMPLRAGNVVPALEAIGVDVLLCTVSPPDRFANHSFGASVSYPLPVARSARTVLAELQEGYPFTYGDTLLPAERIDALVEPAQPPPVYREAPLNHEARRIADFVRSLIPDGATLQIGIGAVSEALLAAMLEDGAPPGLSFWGMGIDAMADLVERGAVRGAPGRPALRGTELMGSERLLAFADRNPDVLMEPSDRVITSNVIGAVDRFVSVNSALQVDLCGGVNAEMLGGRQLSGAGGASDFVEGALRSRGGIPVIAMTSTAGSARHSRIVPRLEPGVPTVTPRHSVRYVVTEHGIAELGHKTLAERAEALIAIADPAHRDELAAARTAA